jgi:hypothetical protein
VHEASCRRLSSWQRCYRPVAYLSYAIPLQATANLRRLVILCTNDEHGWMESYKGSGGAAGMMHLWKSRDDYPP